MSEGADHTHRLHAVRRVVPEARRRQGERVTPLELFFDLVFVLAVTQSTHLMGDQPTWAGIGRGLLVLGVLWWSWVGYAWLTSVVDPEEGGVRLAMFAAMAALLVAAMCVPEAFGDRGLTFAIAYAAVRAAHIALFLLASHDEPQLRHSVFGLAASTAIGCGILLAGSFVHGDGRAAIWAIALVLDMIGPYFFGAEGWRLVPGHFAERHGLIIIIALGESIIALGAGTRHVENDVVVVGVIGVALAAGLWWAYFDVVALLAAERLQNAGEGRELNELARDAYSYLHFPMTAGIVLVALGLEKTLVHAGDPLDPVPAIALCGGAALFLLANVAFKLRALEHLGVERLVASVLLVAVIPLATEASAAAALVACTAVVWALAAVETLRFSEPRDQIRRPA